LAVGAHLKNAVALSVGNQVFISQHIGDLETEQAHSAFRRGIADFEKLYEAVPQIIAAGGQTTLTVGVAASGSTFQWQLNGMDIPGATHPTLLLSNIGTTQAGAYTVAITSATFGSSAFL